MGSGTIGTISLITQTGEFERKYFISNPDITFFKSVYRKHTNFSKYLIRKRPDLIENSATGTTVHHSIQTGSDDLLSKVYLENKLTFTRVGAEGNTVIFANLGSNLLDPLSDDSLSIDIGSNKGVFKSNGLFQEVRGELENQITLGGYQGTITGAPELQLDKNIISCKNGSHYNYTTLSGGVRGMTLTEDNFAAAPTKNVIETEYFYTIPEFSFMKDYGLALPLLSLRNEPITFNVKYQTFDKVFTAPHNIKCDLESNFIQELIHLDNDEKSRFLTSQLTYLTESIFHIKINEKEVDISSTFKLCKYLFLVGWAEDRAPLSETTSPTTLQSAVFDGLNINLGGNLLYPGGAVLPASIFTKLNINKYFIGCGRDLQVTGAKSYGQLDSIAMIPFSIEPTNFTQPSGCVSTLGNSNRIQLTLTSSDTTISLMLFAINYGILQISDGKAQLQYS